MNKLAKILIVEDENIVAFNLQARLEKMGYKVLGVVDSGAAALFSIESELPDLVLLDINIKGEIDGIITAIRIRERFNIPVIYLTAYADKETLERAKITEPYGYLIKPFEAKELSSNIEIALYKHQMEQRIKESELKFRTIFEQSFNWIWLLQPDGTVLEINQTVLDLTDISTEEAVGAPFWQGQWWLFSRVEEEQLKQAIAQADQGKTARLEIQIQDINQQIRTLDLSIKPVTLATNRVILLVAEGRDISEWKAAMHQRQQAEFALQQLNIELETKVQQRTQQLQQSVEQLEAEISDRRQVEAALRESEARFHKLAANVPGMIYQYLMHPDGSIEFPYVSPGSRSIYELEPEIIEQNTQKAFELVHPDDRQSLEESSNTSARTLEPWQWEGRILTVSGRLKWIQGIARPEQQPNGDILWDGLLIDISDRKQTEVALCNSESRLQMALEAAQLGTWDWNLKTNQVNCSEKTESIFGFAKGSFPGTLEAFLNSIYPPDQQLVTQALQTALAARMPYNTEARIQHPDGTIGWIACLGNIIYEKGGQPIQMIGVVMDITERKKVEENLRLRDRAIAATHNGIVIVDAKQPDRPIIYVNPAFEQMTGYSAAEVLGKNARFLQGKESSQPGLKKLRTALRQGTDTTVILRNYRRDGSLFWNELSVSPLYDHQGNLTHYVGIQTDISDRKQSEEELRATTSRFSALIENLQLGVLVKNEWNQVVLINQAFCDIFNIPVIPPALIGADFSDFPEDYKNFFKAPQEFVQRHREIQAAKQIVTDKEIQMANGRIFERDYVPIFVQGKYSGNLWMYRDITERKQAEVSLQQAKDQLQVVLDAVPGFVSWISDDLRYIGVNRHLAESFGLPPDDFIGQDVGFLENGAMFAESIRQFFASPKQADSQVIDVLIQGDIHNYLIITQKYQQGSAVVSIGIDITDRKKNESKLQSSLKEKEILLKEIHHRVKNNLQVISSLLKLQSAYIKDEAALALFIDSYNRVRSMALIHEKLYQSEGLAKIDAADYIRNLVENLLRSYNMASSTIKFNMELEDISLDIDTAIPCGLIINELVSNALKYAFVNQKQGEITIKFIKSELERIYLLVADNGVGLPKDFKVEESQSLGLQLVYNLTEQIEGELEINGENGTKFMIQFPQRFRS